MAAMVALHRLFTSENIVDLARLAPGTEPHQCPALE
jgi:hypothetical protein